MKPGVYLATDFENRPFVAEVGDAGAIVAASAPITHDERPDLMGPDGFIGADSHLFRRLLALPRTPREVGGAGGWFVRILRRIGDGG